jgi:hypothetical protein
MKKMTFIAAMKDYFGMKQGQSPMDFLKEVKMLTDDDKKWFRENLPSVGYQIEDAIAA